MGCSYCGKPGCGWETCEERLEDRWGTPSEYRGDLSGEKRGEEDA